MNKNPHNFFLLISILIICQQLCAINTQHTTHKTQFKHSDGSYSFLNLDGQTPTFGCSNDWKVCKCKTTFTLKDRVKRFTCTNAGSNQIKSSSDSNGNKLIIYSGSKCNEEKNWKSYFLFDCPEFALDEKKNCQTKSYLNDLECSQLFILPNFDANQIKILEKEINNQKRKLEVEVEVEVEMEAGQSKLEDEKDKQSQQESITGKLPVETLLNDFSIESLDPQEEESVFNLEHENEENQTEFGKYHFVGVPINLNATFQNSTVTLPIDFYAGQERFVVIVDTENAINISSYLIGERSTMVAISENEEFSVFMNTSVGYYPTNLFVTHMNVPGTTWVFVILIALFDLILLFVIMCQWKKASHISKALSQFILSENFKNETIN
ncbi:hypothetical protein M0812_04426 [Anaeramoeba flamelloides]|uniref:Uncharacterized protein n=1 Tax=Anaeramoeba flamelloides TaxID=1746091 RepID=A0AAV8AEU1_9EUKA|nr:hypothetical protein M0812_04426 [Anaeramoeba flamelloides]